MIDTNWIIFALTLLNLAQFVALVVVLVKVAPMLPESVVKDLLSHVARAGLVVAEEGLARVEAVAKLTPTQLDDLAVEVAKRVIEEVKSGAAVQHPLEEK